MLFNTPAEKDSANEALPPGQYRVLVESTAWKPTKAGTGHFAAIIFQVVQGQWQGKKLFANFNLDNPSEVATRIGKAEFKRFLMAIGVMTPIRDEHDMQRELVNKSCYVDVENELYQGEQQAKVKSYSAQPGAGGLMVMPSLSSPRSAHITHANDPSIPPF